MHFIGKRNGCDDIQHQMGFDASGTGFGGNHGGAGISGSQPPLNTRMHFAATFDGSDFVFYRDEVQAGGSASLGPAYPAPLEIGNSGTCGQIAENTIFKGLIDEVALFHRALSATEIADLYATGSVGHCKDLPPRVLSFSPANGVVVTSASAVLSSSVNPSMEGSEDLRTWTLLLENVAGTGGVLQARDPEAASYQRYFYCDPRVRRGDLQSPNQLHRAIASTFISDATTPAQTTTPTPSQP